MAALAESKEQLIALLRASTLFRGLDDTALPRLADELEVGRFDAGTTITREGEPGDRCFLVAAGQVGAIGHDLLGQEVTLGVFGPGDTFGEAALVSHRPQTATTRAFSDLTVYALTRADFDRLLAEHADFAVTVRRYVELLAVDGFLKTASPFANLPRELVWQLAGELEDVWCQAGDVVIRESEEGDRFYLIRSGRVEVLHGKQHVHVLGPGDCFGEIALLEGGRRTATVRAVEDTDLLSLSKPDFAQILASDVTIHDRVGELARIRHGGVSERQLALSTPRELPRPLLPYGPNKHYWRSLLVVGLLGFAWLTVVSSSVESWSLTLLTAFVGAFVGPVVYVVYLVERNLLGGRPLTIVPTFIAGAAFGIPVAYMLTTAMRASSDDLPTAVLVAVVEEAAKLLGVLWLLRKREYRFEMDGVIYGAAAGMGFAAFESVLYGLNRGLSVLWLRAVLSPFGHGTWTAIVCAAIWREKGSGRPVWDSKVAAAFSASVLLHGLWNWLPWPGDWGYVWLLLVGGVGLLSLRGIVREAAQEEQIALLRLNPELADAQPDMPRVACHSCHQASPPGTHYCVRCGSALHR